jgi:plasmid stability protein
MAQLIVENLNPLLLEKLKSLSQRHGRSLNQELIAILEQAVNTEAVERAVAMTEATEKLEQAQARYAGRTFSDSTELVREERQR